MFAGDALAATVRVIVKAAPLLSVALFAWITWKGLQPVLYTLAIGRLVDGVAHFSGSSIKLSFGNPIFMGLLAVCGLFICNLCFGSLADSLTSAIGWRINRFTGHKILAAVSRPERISHLEDPSIANDIAVALGEVEATDRRVVGLMSSIVGARVSGITMAVMLFQFRWWAPFAIAAAALVTRRWMIRDLRSFERGLSLSAARLRRGAYFRTVASTAMYAKELRVFGILDWAIEKMTGLYIEGFAEVWRERRENRWTLLGAIALQVAAFGFVGSAVAAAGSRGEIGAGYIAIFLQATWGMLSLIESPSMEYDFRRAALALLQVLRLDFKLGELEQRTHDIPRNSYFTFSRAIHFERICFHYGAAGRSVLKDFTLRIPCGSSIAIVGANGAGKTTLINLLTGLYAPQEGKILVDGLSLEELDLKVWRRQCAVIFQDFCHWPLSLRENIALAFPDLLHDDCELWRLLQKAGAEAWGRNLPRGLDTILSRDFSQGIELSGGQWQRIALARALVALEGGAKLLILDEPTAHMDVRAEAEFYRWFLNETKGITTILISHRFSTIRCAEQIIVLGDGRLVESGSHEELLANDGIYAKQFRLQAEPYQENRRYLVDAGTGA